MSDKLAVGYIRRSVMKEGERTYSIEAQREAIEKLAAEHGYTLKTVYQDAAEGMNFSGRFEDNRPAWLQLKRDLEANHVDAVIMYAWDRASRNPGHAFNFLNLARERGVAIITKREGVIDTESAAGQFFAGIMTVAGGFEANLSSERTRAAMRQKISQGYHMGSTPFGYQRTADGELQASADADLVRMIYRLYTDDEQGFGWIAHYLNNQGHTIASHVTGYTPIAFGTSSIRTIMCNHWLYRGFIVGGSSAATGMTDIRHHHDETSPPEASIRSSHIEPLITEEQAVAAAEALRRRTRTGPRRKQPALLTGIIYCRRCGARKYATVIHHNKDYHYYVHMTPGCDVHYVRREAIDRAVLDQLAGLALDESDVFRVKQMIREREFGLRDRSKDAEAKKEKLQAAISRLNRMYQWGTVGDDEYLKEFQRLKRELSDIPRPQTSLYDVDGLALEVKRLSENLPALPSASRRKIVLDIIERVEVDRTGDDLVIYLTPTASWAAFWQDVSICQTD